MHKNAIVVNTGPIIAISAALGSLEILKNLYEDIFVTFEVCQEIAVSGYGKFASDIFINSDFITKISEKNNTSHFLLNSLDIGEATVISFALQNNIQRVCIDEAMGRRIARLSGLNVTGSIGILLKAKENGYEIKIKEAIEKMREKGVWISKNLEMQVIKIANE